MNNIQLLTEALRHDIPSLPVLARKIATGSRTFTKDGQIPTGLQMSLNGLRNAFVNVGITASFAEIANGLTNLKK